MKARSGLFLDNHNYQCLFKWPTGSVSQCGGKNVDGIGQTDFFEVFINNPKMNLRGEGESVKIAETIAWSKWEAYINCTEHKFERKFNHSTIGVCSHCKSSIADYFEPDECCSECGHSGVNNYIDGKLFCYKHYMQKAKVLVETSEDKYEVSLHGKTIWRFEVLESLNAFVNVKKDYEYHDIYMKAYNQFFEYSMDTCKVYKDQINENHKLHFIDLLEEIEGSAELYKNLYTLFLVLNKGFKTDKNLVALEAPLKQFFKSRLDV